MNIYEPRAYRSYTRMASVTLVEYKKTLVERDVANALLEDAADNYERLIDDIKSLKSFNIEGIEYEIRQVLKN